MLLRSGQVINLLHVITIDPDDPKSDDVYVMLTGQWSHAIRVDKKDAKLIRRAIIDLTSRIMAKLL